MNEKIINNPKITIGLIGGYGLQKILEKKRWINVKTDYGQPSSAVALGKIGDKKVALICRHGQKHTIAPHRINHLANIWALHQLGAEFILNTAAAGIINKKIKPGSFILPDDFIDFRFQATTFFNDFKEGLKHTDLTNPYSVYLRNKIKSAAKKLKIEIHEKGIYINTMGPRFETAAEIHAFKKMGADIVGMTIAPEIILANEVGIEIATVAIGTNWAAGINKEPLTEQEVIETMGQKNTELNRLIRETVKLL